MAKTMADSITQTALAKLLGVSRNKVRAAITAGRIAVVERQAITQAVTTEEAERIKALVERGEWDWGKKGRPKR